MAFPKQVRLVEMSPRDGLQNEPGPVIATAIKTGLIDRLAGTAAKAFGHASPGAKRPRSPARRRPAPATASQPPANPQARARPALPTEKCDTSAKLSLSRISTAVPAQRDIYVLLAATRIVPAAARPAQVFRGTTTRRRWRRRGPCTSRRSRPWAPRPSTRPPRARAAPRPARRRRCRRRRRRRCRPSKITVTSFPRSLQVFNFDIFRASRRGGGVSGRWLQARSPASLRSPDWTERRSAGGDATGADASFVTACFRRSEGGSAIP